jgi:hypothetical protein
MESRCLFILELEMVVRVVMVVRGGERKRESSGGKRKGSLSYREWGGSSGRSYGRNG